MAETRNAAGYLRLAERIKQHIRDNMQVGDRLPSRAELEETFEETTGVVRQALDHLKYEGVIAGAQGRRDGYEILRVPGEPDPMIAEQSALRRLVAQLRDEVRNLGDEVADLRREVRGSGA